MMVEDRRVDRNSSVIINMMAQANKASRGAAEEQGEHELNLVTGDKLASRGWGVDAAEAAHKQGAARPNGGGGGGGCKWKEFMHTYKTNLSGSSKAGAFKDRVMFHPWKSCLLSLELSGRPFMKMLTACSFFSAQAKQQLTFVFFFSPFVYFDFCSFRKAQNGGQECGCVAQMQILTPWVHPRQPAEEVQ